MPFLNYNGKIYNDDSPVLTAQVRGLRYGDGVFETLLFTRDSFILADEHFPRLWKGLQTLKFQIPPLLTPEKLESETRSLLTKNHLKRARVRWTFFRGNGGLFDPENHKPNYIIETLPLPEAPPNLNSNGLQIDIYPDARKSMDIFSNLKHNNALPYVMAALYAKNHQLNDALVLNAAHRVCESAISNLFLVINQRIVTPPLSEGCVAGTRRSWLMQTCKSLDIPVEEIPVTPEMLPEADELFLSNAINPIRWVSHLGNNKTYGCQFVQELYQKLRQTSPEVFC